MIFKSLCYYDYMILSLYTLLSRTYYHTDIDLIPILYKDITTVYTLPYTRIYFITLRYVLDKVYTLTDNTTLQG